MGGSWGRISVFFLHVGWKVDVFCWWVPLYLLIGLLGGEPLVSGMSSRKGALDWCHGRFSGRGHAESISSNSTL